jgi:hypothetical protein
MTVERTRPKNVFRRVERWVVGIVMAVIALVLERVVLRSIKRSGKGPKVAEPTPIQSSGNEINA